MKHAAVIFALLLPFSSRSEVPAGEESILDVLRGIVARPPPNPGEKRGFLSCSIVERRMLTLSGELRSDIAGDSLWVRELTIASGTGPGRRSDVRYIPVTDAPDELRGILEEAIGDHDQSRSFEPGGRPELLPPLMETEMGPIPDFPDRRAAWRFTINRARERLAAHPSIVEASVNFTSRRDTRWLANSAGGVFQYSDCSAELLIRATCRPQSGLDFTRTLSFFARAPDGLPVESDVLSVLDKLVREMEALRTAPVVTSYSGPTMLSGRAAAVMLTTALLHRTAASPPLPPTLRVFDDPAMVNQSGFEFRGFCPFDTGGRRLMRSPVSLVNGRPPPSFTQFGTLDFRFTTVGSPDALNARFIDLLKQKGAASGLYIMEAEPAPASRSHPGVPMLAPTTALRFWPGGRVEPVRIEGFLAALPAHVIAADDDPEIGDPGIPPAIAPAVLLDEASIQGNTKR